MPPFGSLDYLYVGCANYARDRSYYLDVLGAELVWEFDAFGAKVGAFRLGGGPLVLLADHRPAPSMMPVYRVLDLSQTVATLEARGWTPEGEAVEIPDGPCHVWHDPSGNPFAFYEAVRPDALSAKYSDA